MQASMLQQRSGLQQAQGSRCTVHKAAAIGMLFTCRPAADDHHILHGAILSSSYDDGAAPAHEATGGSSARRDGPEACGSRASGGGGRRLWRTFQTQSIALKCHQDHHWVAMGPTRGAEN